MKVNVEQKTINNTYYRNVLYTTPNMQLVVMSVKNEIPSEKHHNTSQFIRVEEGFCTAYIGDKRHYLKPGDAVIIPPNTTHRIVNSGKKPLKIYTIYSPPEHKQGLKER